MSCFASVSVVVPCFRCGQTLARAVASVAEQTLVPQELILVDDGSGDNTRALMEQLQGEYLPGWIRLVLLDCNAGAASARNAGWEQARGKYVAFLDADDAWHPSKVELQFQFMEAHPEVDVSGHGYRQMRVMPESSADIRHVTFKNIFPLYVLLKNPFVTPSFMVRRCLEFRFLSGRRYMEDHYFLMQISMAGRKIARGDAELAYIFKSIYGDSGLSANLNEMQRCELENYRLLLKAGSVSWFSTLVLSGYSWLKFFRRILVTRFRVIPNRK